MDLGILNTVIAFVIVLLVLSLLVQSIQTLVKKVLKLKSHQIAGSLIDLYDQAIGSSESATPSNTQTGFKEGLRSLMGKSEAVNPSAELFKTKVLEQFKNMGRKTLRGQAVLDSLSKEDLFKVIGKLDLEEFFPAYFAKFRILCDQISELRKAIEALTANTELRGSASTKVAEIRSILAPIFNDVSAIVDGTQVKPKVLFADLLRLGKLDVSGILNLLDDAQKAIAEQTKVATEAADADEVAALEALSEELARTAKLIGDLSQKFVDAVSPLRNKLEQVEIWFDTVTQSFDERYTRHMRTFSLAISLVVVIVFNANFFHVYRSLFSSDIQRDLIVESGESLLSQLRAPASPTPVSSTVDIRTQVQQSRQEIDALSGVYEGFGFSPLGTEDIRNFLWSLGGWTALTHDDNGQRSPWGMALVTNQQGAPAWRALSSGEWWNTRKDNVVTLLGWIIMVMLLSVGAPFWQETLESLFGIKNLLRQKSATQNIETQSGAGQPRE